MSNNLNLLPFDCYPISVGLFVRAISYWKEALRVAPNNYIEAQNWINSVTRNK